jgi:hypothetical protein
MMNQHAINRKSKTGFIASKWAGHKNRRQVTRSLQPGHPPAIPNLLVTEPASV